MATPDPFRHPKPQHELHTALAAALSRTLDLRTSIERDIDAEGGEEELGGDMGFSDGTPGAEVSGGSDMHAAGLEGCDQLAFTLQQVVSVARWGHGSCALLTAHY